MYYIWYKTGLNKIFNFSVQRLHFLLLDVLQPSESAGPAVISSFSLPPSQTGLTADPGIENHLALKIIFLYHNWGQWRFFFSALAGFWLHHGRFPGGDRRRQMRFLVRRFNFRNLLWFFTFFGAKFWSLWLFWFLNFPGIEWLQGFFLQTFSHSGFPGISFISHCWFNRRFPLPIILFNRVLFVLSHLVLTKSWYCLFLCILSECFISVNFPNFLWFPWFAVPLYDWKIPADILG